MRGRYVSGIITVDFGISSGLVAVRVVDVESNCIKEFFTYHTITSAYMNGEDFVFLRVIFNFS